jgi:hypothetical protein
MINILFCVYVLRLRFARPLFPWNPFSLACSHLAGRVPVKWMQERRNAFGIVNSAFSSTYAQTMLHGWMSQRLRKSDFDP